MLIIFNGSNRGLRTHDVYIPNYFKAKILRQNPPIIQNIRDMLEKSSYRASVVRGLDFVLLLVVRHDKMKCNEGFSKIGKTSVTILRINYYFDLRRFHGKTLYAR